MAASVFDGMAGVLHDVFGAPVTVTPPNGPAFTVHAVLRQFSEMDSIVDGRTLRVHWATLEMPASAPAVPVGATVTGTAVPGRVFRVLARVESTSPAADAPIRYDLQRVP
jgi:hypothetical protein